jgi:hypothetical protein
VQKALADGRITRDADGGTDPCVADKAWQANTRQRAGFAESQPEKRSPDFNGGARWFAERICSAGRRLWPGFVSDLDLKALGVVCEHERPLRLVLIALLCHTVEAWAAEYLVNELPEIDWEKHFGPAAQEAAAAYADLRSEFGSGK